MRRFSPAILLLLALVGCGDAARSASPTATPALRHEAYVWQRAWTGSVSQAVLDVQPEVAGLRVLTLEVTREAGRVAYIWPDVDAASLAQAGRPVTAVVRVDGARPVTELSLAPVLAKVATWRAQGVTVVGIEMDHDCATAALPDYAAWLRRARPAQDLRWSITALPTWAGSPVVTELAAAVDELVLQVHAVRAPDIFVEAQARRWLERFASMVDERPIRVALPTYRAQVRGQLLAARPDAVASFVRGLRTEPVVGVRGVVWFRLPVATDVAAWSQATLRAVIQDRPLAAEVGAELVPQGPGRFDVVVHNRGTVSGHWPHIQLSGQLDAADMIRGYRGHPERPQTWTAPERQVRPGDRLTVGWATGRSLEIDAY